MACIMTLSGLPVAQAALQRLPSRCWQQRRRHWRQPGRRRCGARADAQQAADSDSSYSDPFAAQRAELGARVVRHVAGIEEAPDMAGAVHLLPVHIEAPRAWRTLTDGVAARGTAALRAALSPRPYPIPSFHTLAHCRCQLTSTSLGRRFRARQINLFLALIFEQVPAAMQLAGLPPVALSRYDLHHGHLFFAPDCAQLGLLLHAKEYPAAHPVLFDVQLGNCQAGSDLHFDAAAMDTRNLLWLGGQLACLDMAAPALQPLLMPGLELPRTVLEQDLGQPLADVNYFAELVGRKHTHRLFVCVPGP